METNVYINGREACSRASDGKSAGAFPDPAGPLLLRPQARSLCLIPTRRMPGICRTEQLPYLSVSRWWHRKIARISLPVKGMFRRHRDSRKGMGGKQSRPYSYSSKNK